MSEPRPLLTVAFGLPGVMSAWGFAAVRTIVRELIGEHVVVETDCLSAFEIARGKAANGTHILLLSQYPESQLLDAVSAAGTAPILFLETMRSAAAYLIATMRRPALEVVRAVSASAACLAPLREQPRVLALHRSRLGERCIDTLLAYLCCQFELTPSDDEILTIARHLGHGPDQPGAAPDLEAAAGRVIVGYVAPGAAEVSAPGGLVDAVLGPLDALFDFRDMPPIVWPGDAFLRAADAQTRSDGGIDLAGGARCLVYGPYFHMPAGRWAARATLAFGAETRDQTFVLEVVAGDVVGRIRVAPRAPGRYAATVTFATTAPLMPVEMRVVMENGAIEGSLALEEVQITRADDFGDDFGDHLDQVG